MSTAQEFFDEFVSSVVREGQETGDVLGMAQELVTRQAQEENKYLVRSLQRTAMNTRLWSGKWQKRYSPAAIQLRVIADMYGINHKVVDKLFNR